MQDAVLAATNCQRIAPDRCSANRRPDLTKIRAASCTGVKMALMAGGGAPQILDPLLSPDRLRGSSTVFGDVTSAVRGAHALSEKALSTRFVGRSVQGLDGLLQCGIRSGRNI